MNPCPKTKPIRDKSYTAFIRSLACLVCGKPAHCHHEPLQGHGVATKGPDNECLPLCPKCHLERHQYGRTSFYADHGLQWRGCVKAYQKLYKKTRTRT